MEQGYAYQIQDELGNVLDPNYFHTRGSAVLYAEAKKLVPMSETLVIQYVLVPEATN